MIRRPPRSTLSSSSAASDVYKRQSVKLPLKGCGCHYFHPINVSKHATFGGLLSWILGNTYTPRSYRVFLQVYYLVLDIGCLVLPTRHFSLWQVRWFVLFL